MRRKLANFATAVSLLLALVTLLAWFTQPHWLGFGWAKQFELELHVADGYVELTTAHHMTNDALDQRQAGEFFAFHRAGSGWGNPLMAKWDSGWARIWGKMWFGHGSNVHPAQSSSWFAADSSLIAALFIVWPIYWVVRRLRHRRTANTPQPGAAPPI